jgi:hypothetical protein
MRLCPICKRTVPDYALWCDCGYVFKTMEGPQEINDESSVAAIASENPKLECNTPALRFAPSDALFVILAALLSSANVASLAVFEASPSTIGALACALALFGIFIMLSNELPVSLSISPIANLVASAIGAGVLLSEPTEENRQLTLVLGMVVPLLGPSAAYVLMRWQSPNSSRFKVAVLAAAGAYPVQVIVAVVGFFVALSNIPPG